VATSIGQLVVSMVAETGKFRADLAAASSHASRAAGAIGGSFKSIGGSVNSAVGSMLNFRNVIGTVLGTGGLGLLIKNAVQAGDNIAEMAQRVGVSTNALQELTHAANLSGSGVEGLENGLRFLNKTLGEAQSGSKEAAAAFAKIGVDPSKYRDAGEAFGAVADGLQSLGNEAQRTAARLDIFGRGGNELAILLNEGSAGIARMREEAQRLGIVIDSAQLKEAQRLADDFDRLAAVIKGNLTRALIDLGPILLDTMGLFAKFANYAKGLSEVYKDIFASNETASLDELANRIVDVTEKIKALKAANKPGSPLIADPKELAILEAQLFSLRELLRTRQTLEAKPPPTVSMTVTGGGIDPKALKDLEEFRRKLLLLAIPDETARKLVELRIETEKLKAAAPASLASQYDAIAAAIGRLLTEAGAEKALIAALDETEASVKDLAAAQGPLMEGMSGTELSVTDVDKAISNLLDTIEGGGQTVDGVTMSFRAMAEAQGPLQEGISGTREAIDQAGIASRKAGEAMRLLVETPLEKYTRTVAEINALYDEMGAKTIDLETRDRALAKAKEELSGATDKVITSLQQQIDAFGMTAREAAIWNDQLRLSADTLPEVRAEVEALSGKLFDLKKQQEDAQKLQADLTNVVLNTTLSVSDALVDMALTGKASFKELADAIIRDMTRIIVKMLVLKAIEMTIAAFSGASSSLGTAQGAGTTTAGADITRAAKGAIVKRRPGGHLMIVGEGGKDEGIFPLDSTMNAVGGGGDVTVINEIHNHTDAQVTTNQRRGPDGKMINEIIIKAVNAALGDGSFDQTLSATHGLKRRGVSR
jgi:DNA repair exonuclease SbcCD ATPase subunit